MKAIKETTDEYIWRTHKKLIPFEEVFELQKGESIEDWSAKYDHVREVYTLKVTTIEEL